MNASKAKALIIFGSYLIVAGIVGYLSNPTKAITALYSGGLFGFLSLCSGFFLQRGKQWAAPLGLTLTIVLSLVFLWRAGASWLAVINGNSEKTIAAFLISSMLIAALFTSRVMLKKNPV